MDYRKKIYLKKNPYGSDDDPDIFLKSIIQNIQHHRKNCSVYNKILEKYNFDETLLKTEEDLYRIPPIPTLFFKKHKLFSMNENKAIIKAKSSGTNGIQSQVIVDKKSLYYGIRMMINYLAYNKLISIIPTNYIVLGYKPSRKNQMGATKSIYGGTKFAPALHREYAIIEKDNKYIINDDGIKKALIKYAKSGLPVRFLGFPAYMYFLIKELKENNIKIKLNKKSKVMLGGGWKQYTNDKIDTEKLYEMIEETLGIKRENCIEFYSAVEHPLPYTRCSQGNFHIPRYSRVIIRDVKSLDPVQSGQIGLLNFLTPLATSMPLTSVITDDLAIITDNIKCKCGNDKPYFTLLGRAGVNEIKTCAEGVSEILKGKES